MNPTEVTEVPRLKFPFDIVKNKVELNYVTHSSITILSDDDFGNYSFPGLGTKTEPYIITNLNITTTNDSAISVANTTKSFIIVNCFLSANFFGIHLYNVAPGTCILENNNCSITNFVGIWAQYSDEIEITNNTCTENDENGILLEECHRCNITENSCERNPMGGIVLDYCMDSQIDDNIIIENSENSYVKGGIRVYYSKGSRVRNNYCINNQASGIYCHSSNGSIIEQNYVYNNNNWTGIVVTNSVSVAILNNTISSNKASLTVYLSPKITIRWNNLFVTGLELSDDYENHLEYVVCENFVNNYKLGFFLDLKRTDLTEPIYGQIIIVSGYKINIKNQLSTSDFCGIALYNCEKVTIANLRLVSSNYLNRYAIKIAACRNVEVINTICKNWKRGIHLEDSEYVLIKSNLIENNRFTGIFVRDSSSITLVNNTVKENTDEGMSLYGSDNCELIYNNFIRNNEEYAGCPGLILTHSDYNVIHHNNFIENDLDGDPQAMDFGEDNIWFNEKTLSGSYWSDWTGEGPYSIYSWISRNITDPYPLSEPAVYIEPNYFAIYFSVILIIPIVVTSIVQIVSRRKAVT